MTGFGFFGRVFLLALVVAAGNSGAVEPVIAPHRWERAGIAVARLQAAHASPTIPAIGAVLDPAPLISLAGQRAVIGAQIAGAKAKVVLEQQQMAQASALQHRQVISLADYQKAAGDLAANQAVLAEAQARSATLLAQVEAAWGPAVAAAIRDNSDPLPQLGAGKAMLVGLSLPPGRTIADPPHEVEAEAAGIIRFRARLIGPVPKMLGGFPGQGLLYQAVVQPGIPVGTTVSALIPAGRARTGVVVPWSAVLWQGGQALVFRAGGGDRFEPVPVATDLPLADGYFVSARLALGDRVVVHGAVLLLGAGKAKAPAAGEADDD